ncbi:hypothetical protein FHG87_017107 [Trinorchestia longiramus]|nr:hypothetical protein FHG87_017107 [Trinorchestia longiramus]
MAGFRTRGLSARSRDLIPNTGRKPLDHGGCCVPSLSTYFPSPIHPHPSLPHTQSEELDYEYTDPEDEGDPQLSVTSALSKVSLPLNISPCRSLLKNFEESSPEHKITPKPSSVESISGIGLTCCGNNEQKSSVFVHHKDFHAQDVPVVSKSSRVVITASKSQDHWNTKGRPECCSPKRSDFTSCNKRYSDKSGCNVELRALSPENYFANSGSFDAEANAESEPVHCTGGSSSFPVVNTRTSSSSVMPLPSRCTSNLTRTTSKTLAPSTSLLSSLERSNILPDAITDTRNTNLKTPWSFTSQKHSTHSSVNVSANKVQSKTSVDPTVRTRRSKRNISSEIRRTDVVQPKILSKHALDVNGLRRSNASTTVHKNLVINSDTRDAELFSSDSMAETEKDSLEMPSKAVVQKSKRRRTRSAGSSMTSCVSIHREPDSDVQKQPDAGSGSSDFDDMPTLSDLCKFTSCSDVGEQKRGLKTTLPQMEDLPISSSELRSKKRCLENPHKEIKLKADAKLERLKRVWETVDKVAKGAFVSPLQKLTDENHGAPRKERIVSCSSLAPNTEYRRIQEPTIFISKVQSNCESDSLFRTGSLARALKHEEAAVNFPADCKKLETSPSDSLLLSSEGNSNGTHHGSITFNESKKSTLKNMEINESGESLTYKNKTLMTCVQSLTKFDHSRDLLECNPELTKPTGHLQTLPANSVGSMDDCRYNLIVPESSNSSVTPSDAIANAAELEIVESSSTRLLIKQASSRRYTRPTSSKYSSEISSAKRTIKPTSKLSTVSTNSERPRPLSRKLGLNATKRIGPASCKPSLERASAKVSNESTFSESDEPTFLKSSLESSASKRSIGPSFSKLSKPVSLKPFHAPSSALSVEHVLKGALSRSSSVLQATSINSGPPTFSECLQSNVSEPSLVRTACNSGAQSGQNCSLESFDNSCLLSHTEPRTFDQCTTSASPTFSASLSSSLPCEATSSSSEVLPKCNSLERASSETACSSVVGLRCLARRGSVSRGLILRGSVSRGLISRGSVSRGLISRGSVSRGSISRGTVSRGLISRGSVSRGSVSRGSVPRGSVPRGSISRGSVSRGSVSRVSISRDSVSRGSISRDSVSRGSISRGSVSRGSISRGSVSRGLISRGSVYRSSISRGSVSRGSISHGPVSRNTIACNVLSGNIVAQAVNPSEIIPRSIVPPNLEIDIPLQLSKTRKLFFKLSKPLHSFIPSEYAHKTNYVMKVKELRRSDHKETYLRDVFLFAEQPDHMTLPYIRLLPFFALNPEDDLHPLNLEGKVLYLLIDTLSVEYNNFSNCGTIACLENDQVVIFVYGFDSYQFSPEALFPAVTKPTIEDVFNKRSAKGAFESSVFVKLNSDAFVMDPRILTASLSLRMDAFLMKGTPDWHAMQPSVVIGSRISCRFPDEVQPKRNILEQTSTETEKNILEQTSTETEKNILEQSSTIHEKNISEQTSTETEKDILEQSSTIHEKNISEQTSTETEKNILEQSSTIHEKNISEQSSTKQQAERFCGSSSSGIFGKLTRQNHASPELEGANKNDDGLLRTLPQELPSYKVRDNWTASSARPCATNHECISPERNHFPMESHTNDRIRTNETENLSSNNTSTIQRNVSPSRSISPHGQKHSFSPSSEVTFVCNNNMSDGKEQNTPNTTPVGLFPDSRSSSPAITSSLVAPAREDQTSLFLYSASNPTLTSTSNKSDEQTVFPGSQDTTTQTPSQGEAAEDSKADTRGSCKHALKLSRCHSSVTSPNSLTSPCSLEPSPVELDQMKSISLLRHSTASSKKLHGSGGLCKPEFVEQNVDSYRVGRGYDSRPVKRLECQTVGPKRKLSAVAQELHTCMVCDCIMSGSFWCFRVHMNSKRHLTNTATQLRAMSDMLFKIRGHHLPPVDVEEAAYDMVVIREELEEVEVADSDRAPVCSQTCKSSEMNATTSGATACEFHHTFWYQLRVVTRIMESKEIGGSHHTHSEGSSNIASTPEVGKTDHGLPVPPRSCSEVDHLTLVSTSNICPSSNQEQKQNFEHSKIKEHNALLCNDVNSLCSHEYLDGSGYNEGRQILPEFSSISSNENDNNHSVKPKIVPKFCASPKYGTSVSSSDVNPFRCQQIHKRNSNPAVKMRIVNVALSEKDILGRNVKKNMVSLAVDSLNTDLSTGDFTNPSKTTELLHKKNVGSTILDNSVNNTELNKPYGSSFLLACPSDHSSDSGIQLGLQSNDIANRTVLYGDQSYTSVDNEFASTDCNNNSWKTSALPSTSTFGVQPNLLGPYLHYPLVTASGELGIESGGKQFDFLKPMPDVSQIPHRPVTCGHDPNFEVFSLTSNYDNLSKENVNDRIEGFMCVDEVPTSKQLTTNFISPSEYIEPDYLASNQKRLADDDDSNQLQKRPRYSLDLDQLPENVVIDHSEKREIFSLKGGESDNIETSSKSLLQPELQSHFDDSTRDNPTVRSDNYDESYSYMFNAVISMVSSEQDRTDIPTDRAVTEPEASASGISFRENLNPPNTVHHFDFQTILNDRLMPTSQVSQRGSFSALSNHEEYHQTNAPVDHAEASENSYAKNFDEESHDGVGKGDSNICPGGQMLVDISSSRDCQTENWTLSPTRRTEHFDLVLTSEGNEPESVSLSVPVVKTFASGAEENSESCMLNHFRTSSPAPRTFFENSLHFLSHVGARGSSTPVSPTVVNGQTVDLCPQSGVLQCSSDDDFYKDFDLSDSSTEASDVEEERNKDIPVCNSSCPSSALETPIALYVSSPELNHQLFSPDYARVKRRLVFSDEDESNPTTHLSKRCSTGSPECISIPLKRNIDDLELNFSDDSDDLYCILDERFLDKKKSLPAKHQFTLVRKEQLSSLDGEIVLSSESNDCASPMLLLSSEESMECDDSERIINMDCSENPCKLQKGNNDLTSAVSCSDGSVIESSVCRGNFNLVTQRASTENSERLNETRSPRSQLESNKLTGITMIPTANIDSNFFQSCRLQVPSIDHTAQSVSEISALMSNDVLMCSSFATSTSTRLFSQHSCLPDTRMGFTKATQSSSTLPCTATSQALVSATGTVTLLCNPTAAPCSSMSASLPVFSPAQNSVSVQAPLHADELHTPIPNFADSVCCYTTTVASVPSSNLLPCSAPSMLPCSLPVSNFGSEAHSSKVGTITSFYDLPASINSVFSSSQTVCPNVSSSACAPLIVSSPSSVLGSLHGCLSSSSSTLMVDSVSRSVLSTSCLSAPYCVSPPSNNGLPTSALYSTPVSTCDWRHNWQYTYPTAQLSNVVTSASHNLGYDTFPESVSTTLTSFPTYNPTLSIAVPDPCIDDYRFVSNDQPSAPGNTEISFTSIGETKSLSYGVQTSANERSSNILSDLFLYVLSSDDSPLNHQVEQPTSSTISTLVRSFENTPSASATKTSSLIDLGHGISKDLVSRVSHNPPEININSAEILRTADKSTLLNNLYLDSDVQSFNDHLPLSSSCSTVAEVLENTSPVALESRSSKSVSAATLTSDHDFPFIENVQNSQQICSDAVTLSDKSNIKGEVKNIKNPFVTSPKTRNQVTDYTTSNVTISLVSDQLNDVNQCAFSSVSESLCISSVNTDSKYSCVQTIPTNNRCSSDECSSFRATSQTYLNFSTNVIFSSLMPKAVASPLILTSMKNTPVDFPVSTEMSHESNVPRQCSLLNYSVHFTNNTESKLRSVISRGQEQVESHTDISPFNCKLPERTVNFDPVVHYQPNSSLLVSTPSVNNSIVSSTFLKHQIDSAIQEYKSSVSNVFVSDTDQCEADDFSQVSEASASVGESHEANSYHLMEMTSRSKLLDTSTELHQSCEVLISPDASVACTKVSDPGFSCVPLRESITKPIIHSRSSDRAGESLLRKSFTSQLIVSIQSGSNAPSCVTTYSSLPQTDDPSFTRCNVASDCGLPDAVGYSSVQLSSTRSSPKFQGEDHAQYDVDISFCVDEEEVEQLFDDCDDCFEKLASGSTKSLSSQSLVREHGRVSPINVLGGDSAGELVKKSVSSLVPPISSVVLKEICSTGVKSSASDEARSKLTSTLSAFECSWPPDAVSRAPTSSGSASSSFSSSGSLSSSSGSLSSSADSLASLDSLTSSAGSLALSSSSLVSSSMSLACSLGSIVSSVGSLVIPGSSSSSYSSTSPSSPVVAPYALTSSPSLAPLSSRSPSSSTTDSTTQIVSAGTVVPTGAVRRGSLLSSVRACVLKQIAPSGKSKSDDLTVTVSSLPQSVSSILPVSASSPHNRLCPSVSYCHQNKRSIQLDASDISLTGEFKPHLHRQHKPRAPTIPNCQPELRLCRPPVLHDLSHSTSCHSKEKFNCSIHEAKLISMSDSPPLDRSTPRETHPSHLEGPTSREKVPFFRDVTPSFSEEGPIRETGTRCLSKYASVPIVTPALLNQDNSLGIRKEIVNKEEITQINSPVHDEADTSDLIKSRRYRERSLINRDETPVRESRPHHSPRAFNADSSRTCWDRYPGDIGGPSRLENRPLYDDMRTLHEHDYRQEQEANLLGNFLPCGDGIRFHNDHLSFRGGSVSHRNTSSTPWPRFPGRNSYSNQGMDYKPRRFQRPPSFGFRPRMHGSQFRFDRRLPRFEDHQFAMRDPRPFLGSYQPQMGNYSDYPPAMDRYHPRAVGHLSDMVSNTSARRGGPSSQGNHPLNRGRFPPHRYGPPGIRGPTPRWRSNARANRLPPVGENKRLFDNTPPLADPRSRSYDGPGSSSHSYDYSCPGNMRSFNIDGSASSTGNHQLHDEEPSSKNKPIVDVPLARKPVHSRLSFGLSHNVDTHQRSATAQVSEISSTQLSSASQVDVESHAKQSPSTRLLDILSMIPSFRLALISPIRSPTPRSPYNLGLELSTETANPQHSLDQDNGACSISSDENSTLTGSQLHVDFAKTSHAKHSYREFEKLWDSSWGKDENMDNVEDDREEKKK